MLLSFKSDKLSLWDARAKWSLRSPISETESLQIRVAYLYKLTKLGWVVFCIPAQYALPNQASRCPHGLCLIESAQPVYAVQNVEVAQSRTPSLSKFHDA